MRTPSARCDLYISRVPYLHRREVNQGGLRVATLTTALVLPRAESQLGGGSGVNLALLNAMSYRSAWSANRSR